MAGERPTGARRAGPKGPGSRRAATGAPRGASKTRPPSADRIVLASLGPAIPASVVERFVEVAREVQGQDRPAPIVHVVSIARIWGTALGLPHPGLRPNRFELEEQQEIVHATLTEVQRRGFTGKTRIFMTRNPAKAIVRHAESIGASAIVVGDPSKRGPGLLRSILWNPVRDMSRRSRIPVHAVAIDEEMPRALRSGRPQPGGPTTKKAPPRPRTPGSRQGPVPKRRRDSDGSP
jgi:Universal stress protein family